MSPSCPDKDKIPKDKWKHRTASQHMQAKEEDLKAERKSSDDQSVDSAWSEVSNITGVNGFTVEVMSDVTSQASSSMGTKYCGNVKTNVKTNEDKEEIDLKKCIIIDN